MRRTMALVLACASGAAWAADPDEMIKLLDVLRQNGVLTQEQYQQLHDGQLQKQQAAAQASTQQPAAQAVTSPDSNPIELITKDGSFKVQTKDKAYSMQLNGRMEMDSALYSEDKRSLGDGVEMRRVFLSASGVMDRDWGYKIEYDFAGGGNLQDVYLQYLGIDPFKVTAGYFKEPFSLEQLTSDLHTTFMERSLADALAMGRRAGVMGSYYGNLGSLALGAFGSNAEGTHPTIDDIHDNQNLNGGEGDNGWRVAARGTFSPIHETGKVVHLGAAADYYAPNDEPLRFRQRPESHVTDRYLIDTGALGQIDSATSVGAEAAGVYGPFSVQGEYMQTDVDRDDGKSVLMNGWYVYASAFLTGESRAYDHKTGTFGRIKPERPFPAGWGAWEAAIRYSTLDLQDKNVLGGKQDDITFAINWYMTQRVKLKGEYIWASADPSAGASPWFGEKDAPDIFQMRLQYDF